MEIDFFHSCYGCGLVEAFDLSLGFRVTWRNFLVCKPYFCANSLNSMELNGGPLSDWTITTLVATKSYHIGIDAIVSEIASLITM